eukprot:3703821-Rhodomonas_salina.2
MSVHKQERRLPTSSTDNNRTPAALSTPHSRRTIACDSLLTVALSCPVCDTPPVLSRSPALLAPRRAHLDVIIADLILAQLGSALIHLPSPSPRQSQHSVAFAVSEDSLGHTKPRSLALSLMLARLSTDLVGVRAALARRVEHLAEDALLVLGHTDAVHQDLVLLRHRRQLPEVVDPVSPRREQVVQVRVVGRHEVVERPH